MNYHILHFAGKGGFSILVKRLKLILGWQRTRWIRKEAGCHWSKEILKCEVICIEHSAVIHLCTKASDDTCVSLMNGKARKANVEQMAIPRLKPTESQHCRVNYSAVCQGNKSLNRTDSLSQRFENGVALNLKRFPEFVSKTISDYKSSLIHHSCKHWFFMQSRLCSISRSDLLSLWRRVPASFGQII